MLRDERKLLVVGDAPDTDTSLLYGFTRRSEDENCVNNKPNNTLSLMTLLLLFRKSRFGCCITTLKNSPSSYHTQSINPNFINSPIQALVKACNFTRALEHYTKLCHNGFKPDHFTFPHILKASSHLNDQTMGLLVHNQVIKTGFDSNLYVTNSLILFYGQFGELTSTHYLFDKMPERNVVTWTAVIWAFTQNTVFNRAVELFNDMLLASVRPNSYTMATILPAFSFCNGAIQIHGLLIKKGFQSDVYVWTALIDVYAKCGNVFSARQVFDEMHERNLVSWNTMMSCYYHNGYTGESLELFSKMNKCGNIHPDSYSVVTLLSSCSSLTALGTGKEIHCYVYKAGLEETIFVGNSLIDMYGKCGAIEVAEHVFDSMKERDVSSWTALITCYGLHGKGAKAISIFEKMKQVKTTTPNSVTMTAVLTACSHSCLVEDGLRYFATMPDECHIERTMKHYACVVDLLGRACLLEEALKFINNMPVKADVQVWETLLGSATNQGNEKIVEIAIMHLIKLESISNPEVHIQLASAYANVGRWEDLAKIREVMQSKKIKKLPGQSTMHVL